MSFQSISGRAISVILVAIYAVCLQAGASAAIVTAGDLNPIHPGADPWPVGGDLRVGDTGAGSMTISAGGVVNDGLGYLGFSVGSEGTATVTGPGSQWNNSSGLYVGNGGTGTLSIEAGGIASNDGTGILGRNTGSTGAAMVTGAGSQWNNSNGTIVGRFGVGTLTIEDGGVVNDTGAFIAHIAGSTGAATVAGTGARWNSDDFFVGFSGNGMLTIAGGGVVSVAGNLGIAIAGGSTGDLNLTGGTLNMNGGEITAGNGSATFNFTSGTLKNAATINLGGPFVQQGGTLAPGASPGVTNIVGDYAQQSGGTIEIELNGVSNQGVDYDHVDVSGQVNVSGTLDLQVGGGYAPALGDEADVITFGSQTGQFATITNVPRGDLLGLAVRYGHDANQVDMRVSIRGDTDFDDDVDTGDLTDAIINFTGGEGSGNTWSEGDYNGDGDTDTGDLTVAIVNFTGGSAGNANVPDLVYDPLTGNVTIDADGADVISFSLQGGPFSAADFGDLPAGLTDNIASQIGWTSFNLFSGLTGVADLGAILPAGLDEAQLAAVLSTASYGLALSTGGGGGTFDIIIPEPTSLMLMGLAAVMLVGRRRE